MSPSQLFFVWIACLAPLVGYAQSDAYALNRILQQYTETYGGMRDADTLASLSVEGSIEQDGRSYDFLMRRKRPDSMRYRLSHGGNHVTTGYNGSSAWLRVETDGQATAKDLDAAATRALRDKARFDSPLFRHLENRENTLTLVERTTLDGESVYVVQVEARDGSVSRYFLEADTAQLLRLDRLDGAGEVASQTLYRDYREVEGFPIAHEIEERAAGQTVSLAIVKTVEINPGLLSFYFEKPRR